MVVVTNRMELIIGVDGGGTKTVAWVATLRDDVSGAVLGRGRAGPGNPRAAGFEIAQNNIDAAIDAAFADAKLPRETVAAACLCLSGAGRAVEQEQMKEWAEARGVARITRVTGDAEPILAAATPDNWGIALISGTGSLAWGRSRDGRIVRSGGWGFLIGDEGSGYAIALAGLRAAAQAADGRGPRTILLEAFQQRLAAAVPSDLIGRVYDPAMSRERLAELANVVFNASPTDVVAASIVSAAAADLATMVAALVEPLQLANGTFPLAFSGGMLLHHESLRQRLLAALQAASATPSSVTLVPDPVRGAVALARAAAVTSAK